MAQSSTSRALVRPPTPAFLAQEARLPHHPSVDPALGARSVILAATLVAVAACAPGPSRDRIWPSPTGSWPPMPKACEFLVGQRNIAEDVTCATAIALVRVVRFDEPIWNSPDGHDWTEEYNANPTDAFVPTVSVTPVEVRVEQVHTVSGPRDAPGDPPMIADGSDLRVFFIDTGGFEPGDRRVFFLRWTRMWLSDGTATSLLYGDVTRSWVMTGEGTVFPWDSSQRYSLVSGARRGDLSLAGTTCQPSLTLDGFAHIVRRELQSPGPDFATFERWPPGPVQREVDEHSDLPEELDDPGWCPPL
jgi:hypothetical protein